MGKAKPQADTVEEKAAAVAFYAEQLKLNQKYDELLKQHQEFLHNIAAIEEQLASVKLAAAKVAEKLQEPNLQAAHNFITETERLASEKQEGRE